MKMQTFPLRIDVHLNYSESNFKLAMLHFLLACHRLLFQSYDHHAAVWSESCRMISMLCNVEVKKRQPYQTLNNGSKTGHWIESSKDIINNIRKTLNHDASNNLCKEYNERSFLTFCRKTAELWSFVANPDQVSMKSCQIVLEPFYWHLPSNKILLTVTKTLSDDFLSNVAESSRLLNLYSVIEETHFHTHFAVCPLL